MKIDEAVEYLRRHYPHFGRRAMYDVDNHGKEFCEMIYPNEKQPNMPIAVNVFEDGCVISAGQIANVTGDRPIPHEMAVEAISDIINDRIAFVLGYAPEDDIGTGAPFYTQIFPLTGGIDDKSRQLEKLTEKLSTPVTGWRRKFTALKGRFLIIYFSGEGNKTIER